MHLLRRLANANAFRALRHRNYRYLWLGQLGHSATLWMDQVARAVLILDLTGSAMMLSLVIATRLAPILLFGLVAGAVADRANRQRVLMSSQAVTFASHLFLGLMVVSGLIEVWMVFLTAFVAGTAMAFNQPVRQSLIPMTVPREDLLNAVALNSTALSFMRIGGGSLAGVLLLLFDVGGVYLVTATIYAYVLFTTWMMRFPEPAAPRRSETSLFADLREGFGYVGRNPELGVVVALAVILFVLGFPYQQVFTPLLAKRVLDMGDSGVGFLAGATGVGAFLGSLVVAAKSNISRPGVQLLANMFVFGGVLILLSLQATVWGTAFLLALAGSMTVTYMAFTNGILLERSDPAMHGRVMSLLSLDRGLIPLGAIFAGGLVELVGVRPGLFIQGVLVLACVTVAALVAGSRLAAIRSAAATREGTPRHRPEQATASPPTARG